MDMRAGHRFSPPVIVVIMVAAICAVMLWYAHWRENRFNPIIAAAAERHGLDPLLVKAVIRRESNFDPRALGGKGEIGLMQVTPTVGREYAASRKRPYFKAERLFDPTLNIEVGCWYLGKAMRRYRHFPDPAPFALAHYNAGATNVDRWLKRTRDRGDPDQFIEAISYPITRRYVTYVIRRWRRYRDGIF
ncbi:MAG: lytic transglycosylase domain-containing protein [bacterium]|nr:lytic transglycosylase domain-containing protein [bacterium]